MKHPSSVIQPYKANVTQHMKGCFTTVKHDTSFFKARPKTLTLTTRMGGNIHVLCLPLKERHWSPDPPLSGPDLARRAASTYRWMLAAARMAVRRQYLGQYMVPFTTGRCPGVPLRNGRLSQPDNSLQFKSTWRPLKIWPAHNAMREPGTTEAQKGHE